MDGSNLAQSDDHEIAANQDVGFLFLLLAFSACIDKQEKRREENKRREGKGRRGREEEEEERRESGFFCFIIVYSDGLPQSQVEVPPEDVTKEKREIKEN